MTLEVQYYCGCVVHEIDSNQTFKIKCKKHKKFGFLSIDWYAQIVSSRREI